MEQQAPYAQQQDSSPMSMKDWFITLLISYIPLVGFVMLLIWAFDSSTNVNKKNWAKASLIWMLIAIGIAIIIFVLFMSIFIGAMSSLES
jgi:uncharacterized membrane protein